MTTSPLILYDGICNLCNHSIRFVIKNDTEGFFKFASFQSEKGKEILVKHRLNEKDFSSFILIENGELFFKSTAALKVVKKLSGPIRFLYIFIIIPAFIRNMIYDVIAKNRYKWFGKNENCEIPN